MAEPAGWNRGLEPIAPLVDHYAREMGELAGPMDDVLNQLAEGHNGSHGS